MRFPRVVALSFAAVVASLGSFAVSAVAAAEARLPAQCRVISQDTIGLAQTIAVTRSGGRFLVAGSSDDDFFVQTYNATTGNKIIAKRSDKPFVPLKQASGFSLVLGVQNGFVLSGWQKDAERGYVGWLAAFDRNVHYLGMFPKNTAARSSFVPSGGIRVGGEGLAAGQDCAAGFNTVRYSVARLTTARSAYPKPFTSFEMKESRCGQIGGAVELGKAVGMVMQRFSPDNAARLTFAVRSSPTAAWQHVDVTDPLANAESHNNYFIIWNFFAEADRFTVAWLNTETQANELRSYNAQREVVNSLVLPPDVTDIQPVAGGYLISTYDFSSRQAGAALITRSGERMFDLPIATTLAARLPLITWDPAVKHALYAWIDENKDGERKLVTRILECK